MKFHLIFFSFLRVCHLYFLEELTLFLQKHFDQEILRFAVNQEYVVENIILNEDDEIAVFPPVSGG